jgi:hypothetical protein
MRIQSDGGVQVISGRVSLRSLRVFASLRETTVARNRFAQRRKDPQRTESS